MSQITSLGFSGISGCGGNAMANAAQAILTSPEEKSATVALLSAADIRARAEEKSRAAVAEFGDYMQKTPAERMRDDIIKQMGLTEEEIASMPPDERKAVEDKIAEIIKKKLQGGESGDYNAAPSSLQNGNPPGNPKLSDALSHSLLQLQEAASGPG